jgi:hypothetical protein
MTCFANEFGGLMHVLRDYTKQVTLPVFKTERAVTAGNSALRKARTLLIRQPRLLDEHATARLREILSDNRALQTVHEFRERLRELWSGANVSNEKLLAQLKDWCAEAEASGIKVLEDFAARLRSYQLAAGSGALDWGLAFCWHCRRCAGICASLKFSDALGTYTGTPPARNNELSTPGTVCASFKCRMRPSRLPLCGGQKKPPFGGFFST